MAIDFKKAASQANKELEKEAIEEIKGYVKSTLQAIEDKKAEKNKIENELKALKADLYDLENGKLDKIRERQEKDKVAKRVSEVNLEELIRKVPQLQPFVGFNSPNINYVGDMPSPFGVLTTSGTNNMLIGQAWSSDLVAGTYTVTTHGIEKSFYIR